MENKMPKIITLIGALILGVSWLQWFFRFPDTSQLFLGTIGGVCFLGFGYSYWWMKEQDKEKTKTNKRIDDAEKKLNKRIDAITKFYIKEELK